MTFDVMNISASIDMPAPRVYDFVSNPGNLPKWASGFGEVENIGDEWYADSPMGRIRIQFAERNRLGVLDHEVTLPSGKTLYNPMRVVPNNDGCEVIFTLYRRPGVSGLEYGSDAAAVRKDLEKLKSVLETR